MSLFGNIQPPDVDFDIPDITIDPGDIRIGGGGGGSSNERASALVNQAEQLLVANLAAFQAGQRTATAAVRYFDQVWASVVQGCTQLANRACIADRERGGQFDWFRAYRDPLGVTGIPDPSIGAGAGGGVSLPPAPASGASQWLLYAAIGFVALKLLKII